MPQVTQRTHEDFHRALVSRLASEVKPTRRLWSVGVRLTVWMLLEVSILAWVITHNDNDFLHRLAHPVYAIEIVFFAAAAIISALMALQSTIPGRPVRAREIAMGSALVLAGTLLVMTAEPVRTGYQLGTFVQVGLQCAFETCVLAAMPWLVLWWLVRRGFPILGRMSGLFVGSGATLFSFALMRIRCPIDEPLHLIVWHLLPALALTTFSAWAGAAWLRYRSPRSAN